MNTLFLAVEVLVATAIVSVLGMHLVRWIVPAKHFEGHEHVVDPLLNVVATLYSGNY